MKERCKPCEDRGFIRNASRIADNTPMCRKCFTGEHGLQTGVECSIIPDIQVPESSCGVIHQGIKTLSERTGIALKMTVKGMTAQQIQKMAHTYAERAKIKIKTSRVDGVLYVRRIHG